VKRRAVLLAGLLVALVFSGYLAVQQGSRVVARYGGKLEKFEQWALRVESNLDAVKSDLDAVKSDLDAVKSDTAFSMLNKCLSANCSHLSARIAMIDMQISQIGPGGVVFFGDSITEGALIPRTICGKSTTNAGIGGATVGVFSNVARHLVEKSRPSIVVIALGSNDAWRSRKTSIETFGKEYESLVKTALRSGVPVVVTTIPPVEASKPLGDPAFSMEKINQFNLEIRRIARARNLTLVDVHSSLSGPDGFAIKGATIDGIHFSAQTYGYWVHGLVSAVEKHFKGCNS
jgi:lysophospholipase L1-like esterase